MLISDWLGASPVFCSLFCCYPWCTETMPNFSPPSSLGRTRGICYFPGKHMRDVKGILHMGRVSIQLHRGWWEIDCMGNTSLTIKPSEQLWDSGSPSLVQIFRSVACRLLFIAGKNAQLMVVTMLKIVFCSWEVALSNSALVLFVAIVVSMETNRKHYFRSDLCS